MRKLRDDRPEKPMVYVSYQLTSHGSVLKNIHQAAMFGLELREQGFVPVIPHMTGLIDMMVGDNLTYNFWMEWCYDLLDRCDAMMKYPCHSAGVKLEEAFANRAGIPVFENTEELFRWRRREWNRRST